VQVGGLLAPVPVFAGRLCPAPEASTLPVSVLLPLMVWFAFSRSMLAVSVRSVDAHVSELPAHLGMICWFVLPFSVEVHVCLVESGHSEAIPAGPVAGATRSAAPEIRNGTSVEVAGAVGLAFAPFQMNCCLVQEFAVSEMEAARLNPLGHVNVRPPVPSWQI
jgi:hypothetical protein